MQEATKYLNIVKARGESQKPLNRLYRLVRKPAMLQMAYTNLYGNEGANTPGIDPEDVIDGMSLGRIQRLSEELREGRFQWKPVKRVYIPKSSGKRRPLGIPGWKDKMVQESIRLLLTAYYEPRFSDLSHGFRNGRGCHTALTQIAYTGGWTGVKWFIEGDIKGCFDNIDHGILLSLLRRDIEDDRFMKLMREMLQAGYMEDWRYHQTYSGTPQGGVVSPLLSNVYLHELDEYVETTLIPHYTRGEERRRNPEYKYWRNVRQYAKRKGKRERFQEAEAMMRQLPYGDPQDPGFRRLKYVRYADDFLLGLAGPKSEAVEIKEAIREFLRDQLNLEMSEEKTLVTHAATTPAKFLGYGITAPITDTKQTGKRRALNGKIQLRMPKSVLAEWISKYTRNGKPIHRKELTVSSDYDIVKQYAWELNGLYHYYSPAINVGELYDLKYVMYSSLTRTLANKHRMTVTQVLRKHETRENGLKTLMVVVEREGKQPLVAKFGNTPLRRKRTITTIPDAIVKVHASRTELLQRMQANQCEICGREVDVEVHHIRKISDLKRKWQGRKSKPVWVKQMIARNRKTLVVCRECHSDIHGGRYDGPSLTKL
jgi:group II intron reverse transcriptase/maturase